MWSSSGPAHSTCAPTARSTAIITSRSATGGRLRTVVVPRARRAAASCFSPEFFVAPETLIRPESGGPGRTATASIGQKGYCRGFAVLGSPGSAVLVDRRALLDKSRDRFLHVVRRQARRLALRLDAQPVDQLLVE